MLTDWVLVISDNSTVSPLSNVAVKFGASSPVLNVMVVPLVFLSLVFIVIFILLGI